LIWLLTADCVSPMRSPAAAKVPWRHTAMKVLKLSDHGGFIEIIDAQRRNISFSVMKIAA
jgi:hypothetical protein